MQREQIFPPSTNKQSNVVLEEIKLLSETLEWFYCNTAFPNNAVIFKYLSVHSSFLDIMFTWEDYEFGHCVQIRQLSIFTHYSHYVSSCSHCLRRCIIHFMEWNNSIYLISNYCSSIQSCLVFHYIPDLRYTVYICWLKKTVNLHIFNTLETKQLNRWTNKLHIICGL